MLVSVPLAQPALIPDRDDLEAWWMDVDFIIDRQMQVLDQQHYYGQSVPYHFVNLSSSAMPAVLGAHMKFIDKQTMWAYPCFTSVEQVAELAVDPQNIWYQKAIEITRRSAALAKDHHFVAAYALNGITDILAGLYGTENFLVDLIAKPREVARAMEHVKRIWINLFNEVEALIAQSENPGDIGWAGIWAPGTTFPLQEDFSYMISDTMFRQYCLPHLIDQMDAMEYPFYHLDGTGALSHLDTLLAIDKLKVIQWVPGPGEKRVSMWYGLISRILEAGKSMQVFAEADEVEDLVKHVGARGLLVSVSATEEQAQRLIKRYS